jgi:phospholipase C
MPELPPIEYVITLMLENRSFDHVLGFMKSGDYPIDGITPGAQFNLDSTGERINATSDARYSGDFDPDPGHDFDDVTLQLYGRPDPAAGQEPDMSGFVKDYEKRCNGSVPASHRVMRCFDPGMLPAIPTLATLARRHGL